MIRVGWAALVRTSAGLCVGAAGHAYYAYLLTYLLTMLTTLTYGILLSLMGFISYAYLDLSEAIWRYLALPAATCSYLQLAGAIWSYLQ